MWWTVICILLAAMTRVCKCAEIADKSGIDNFWKDDYKAFEHIYGKTSDKEIYGSILPSPVIDTGDMKAATEKQERYSIRHNDPDSSEFEHYFNLKMNKLKTKLSNKQPAKSSVSFISNTNFNPISQPAGSESYNYIKLIDDFEKNKKYNHFNSMRGVKPFTGYGDLSSSEIDKYRSIQDILQAHEKNKANSYGVADDNMKYLRHAENNMKYPPKTYNDVLKPRCLSGRCKRRGFSYRSRSRPYKRPIPKVKKVVVL